MIVMQGFLIAVRAGSGMTEVHTGHGSGPQGLLGSLVVSMAVAVVLLVSGLCAKYFLKPGETSPGHIKRRILQ